MKEKLQRITPYKWLLPKHSRDGMNVNALIFASQKLINELEDEAVTQLTNVTMLPGVIEPVCGMPDIHWGYGLPMGAVGAFDLKEGIISSGMTGFDINCGIHMIKTNLTTKDVKGKLNGLINEIFKNVPTGVGCESAIKLTNAELDNILTSGGKWCLKNNYCTREDLECMEENGLMNGADASKVSNSAKSRGRPQLGTLGAGNHFLEIQKVETIMDEKIAQAFGLKKEHITVMIHCGSRGLGHQIATDYLQIMQNASQKYSIKLPDPQLVCAPVNSEEGQSYYKAMQCAVNYAFANRLVITQSVRKSFENVFKMTWQEMEMETVYDICHNIAKIETFENRKLLVHRKGSTRSLPAGNEKIPVRYRNVGQPVLIAGSMGTASYVMVGTEKATTESFGSSCHGSGRSMSRHGAIKQYSGETIRKELLKEGIIAKASNPKVLAEEAPNAYKDVDEVVKSVHEAGLSRMVCRVTPLGVVKG